MDGSSWLPASLRRPTLAITLAAITVLVAITAWNGWTDYRACITGSEAYRSYLATIAANSVLSRMRSMEQAIDAVSASYLATEGTSRDFNDVLVSMLPLLTDSYWVGITGPHGIIRYSSSPSLVGSTLRGLPPPHDQNTGGGETLFMSPPLDTPDGQYAILISRPLGGQADKNPARVVLAVKPLLFYQDLATALPNNNGSIVLFGRDYIIRLRLPITDVAEGKSLSGYPVTEAFFTSGKTEGHYRVKASLDGVERFVTFRSLPGSSGLVVTVSEEADLVVEHWRAPFLGLVLLTALGAGLILLLYWFTVRAASAERIAESKMREQMAMLTSLLDNLPVEACAHDLHGGVIFRSVRCRSELGKLNAFPVDAPSEPDAYLRDWEDKKSQALTGVSTKTIEEHTGANGSKRIIENYCGPIYQDERIIGSLGVNIDITELKRAEKELRNALAEKEIMLQEIHHRVKNNLQIILSLITLQCNTEQGAGSNSSLSRTCDRIRGMALIHEQLYRSGDFSNLDMRQYVPALLNQIRDTFDHCSANTCLELEIGHVRLPLDRAVPFGLLLNELATNAFKHAFQNGGNSMLKVHLEDTGGGKALLLVQDNRPGLPHDFDLLNDSTLGMQLIRVLSSQLGGEARAYTDNGACFEISFMLSRTSHRQHA